MLARDDPPIAEARPLVVHALAVVAVAGAAWWLQIPVWKSRISSLPSRMGMQHCMTPEGLCLYSSSSIKTKDLACLMIRRT